MGVVADGCAVLVGVGERLTGLFGDLLDHGCGEGSPRCGDAGCAPCQLPRQLAPVRTVIGAGSELRVHFAVSNRSRLARDYLVAATGDDADLARGAPSAVTIDPMASGSLTAVIRVPRSVPPCTTLSLTLWVRGCGDFVLPVRIRPLPVGCGQIRRRRVLDQSDTRHTWADHFATTRPCAA